MKGKHISYAVAVAALLLVGAGCAAGGPQAPQPEAVNSGALAPKQENQPGATADVNATGPISPDAAVNAVLNDAANEKEHNTTLEKDSAEVDSDKSAVNAYGDATYDVNATQ